MYYFLLPQSDSSSWLHKQLAFERERIITESFKDRQYIIDNYRSAMALHTLAIAKLDNESTCDKLILIDERLEKFKTKRQEMKDFVDAYLNLKSSRN